MAQPLVKKLTRNLKNWTETFFKNVKMILFVKTSKMDQPTPMATKRTTRREKIKEEVTGVTKLARPIGHKCMSSGPYFDPFFPIFSILHFFFTVLSTFFDFF